MVSKDKAFEIALENRKFEIELYWKRAKYFFDAFLALGGVSILISVLQTSKAINLSQPIFFAILFAVECVGLVCAIAWSLVNEGSKYWQENWEHHVDDLGKDIVGPLFKNTIKPTNKLKRYSVSTINLYLSRYIIAVWGVMILVTLAVWIFACCPLSKGCLDSCFFFRILLFLFLGRCPLVTTTYCILLCECFLVAISCILFAACSLVAICYMLIGAKRGNNSNNEDSSNFGTHGCLNNQRVSKKKQESLSKKEEERRVKIRLFSLFTILSHSKSR